METGAVFLVDISLGLLFLLVVGLFLLRHRAHVKLERMLFPAFYAILYRGTFGIPFLKRLAQNYREWCKLFGYCSIGVGFVGMAFAVVMMLFVAFFLVFRPQEQAVAPFLPFISVPGIGYISFMHWIIAIAVIVIIHESAHALVAMAHGLRVKHTGFGLFAVFIPFLPAAFVEPDEKQLTKQSDVVQYSIFSAGPMSNFVLMIPLALILLFAFPAAEQAMYDSTGFSFDPILEESYPAELANLSAGQTFNRFNGEAYDGIEGPYKQMQYLRPGDTVTFGYVDEQSGETLSSYAVAATEHPDVAGRGFLGITNLHTVFMAEPGLAWLEPFYAWVKGLVRILFIVTFAIGLINLFPAGMIDGGRMFMLACERLTGDAKKTQRIVSLFAVFFWAIILFGFVTFFAGNPFTALFG